MIDTTRTGKVELIEATRDDIPLVEDLARFYLYDMARQIGPHEDWVANDTWRNERMDLSYAWNEGNHPFRIEVDGNVAGFCLIDRYCLVPGVDWNMGQFYVSGPWAGRGVGRRAAESAFNLFTGCWQVVQYPQNRPAVLFWRRVIDAYSGGAFAERLVPGPNGDNTQLNVMTFAVSDTKPRS